jgi:Zn-finger nucleic acid-binding protein
VSSVVRALECPKCGAPIPPTSGTATCGFCGTAVVIEPEAPPAAAPAGRAPAGDGATKLPCPRCDVALFETRVGDFLLDGCGVCGGIWIDNACSRALTKHPVPKVVAMADRAERHATEQVDVLPEVVCPQCGATMQRVREPRSGVDLDVCKAHGTWFDARELQRVSRAYSFRPPRAPPVPAQRGAPEPIPDFRAGSHGEDVVTGGLAVLGVLGTILSLVGSSTDS